MNPRLRVLAALFALALSPACVTHSHVEAFSGVDGIRGEPIEYQTTTTYALHGLFVFPLIGNGKKSYALEQFAAEAAERGGTRMRVTQTSSLTYWFILPPLSFFVHPVVTTVEGDVEGTVIR
ncbi:MAG: hypothetical protein R3F49_19665 [Planctomycetota bacterium]